MSMNVFLVITALTKLSDTNKLLLSPSHFTKTLRMVENIGVEPMTSCVQGKRSSQLS